MVHLRINSLDLRPIPLPLGSFLSCLGYFSKCFQKPSWLVYAIGNGGHLFRANGCGYCPRPNRGCRVRLGFDLACLISAERPVENMD
jgi:hypothetical protein